MKKIAFIFPGQGSQFVGMGKDIYDNYEIAKNIYDNANKILNKNITKLCFEGPEDDLKLTVNSQPAILTTSIALLELLKSKSNITPDFCAGHSLGEYCALYSAGVIDFETTIKLIQKRADLMGKIKGGSMAAILNATDEQIKSGIKEGLKFGYVDIANYNSPVQTVITGDEKAVTAASNYLSENGAKRVIPLNVSGAFHSKYMENAGFEFNNYLTNFNLNNAKIPVITNVDAKETINAEEFKIKMPKQIYSSVYWTQTIQNMISLGVDTFIEIGPNKILAGLNKKINPDVKTFNIFDKESLESTINLINSEFANV